MSSATDKLFAAMHAVLRPDVITPLGAKTAGAAWDADSDELAIPAGTLFLHAHVDQDCYLVVDTGTADPSPDPCIYAGGGTYVIPCWGMTKLHYKRAGDDDATVSVTAFGS